MTRDNIRKSETGEPTNNGGEFGTTRKNEPRVTALNAYDPPVTFTELLADEQELVISGDKLNSDIMDKVRVYSLGSRYACAAGSIDTDFTETFDQSDEWLTENAAGLEAFFKETYDLRLSGDEWNAKTITAHLSFDNNELTDILMDRLDVQTNLRELHDDTEDLPAFRTTVTDFLEARTTRLNGPKPVHEFYDSGTGYDETQTRDDIKDGDVLAVTSEPVVGFLNEAWPVAVTSEPGEFHRIKQDKEAFLADHPQYVRSWAEAEAKALELGYDIDYR